MYGAQAGVLSEFFFEKNHKNVESGLEYFVFREMILSRV
jgi:hypothetical protein